VITSQNLLRYIHNFIKTLLPQFSHSSPPTDSECERRPDRTRDGARSVDRDGDSQRDGLISESEDHPGEYFVLNGLDSLAFKEKMKEFSR
jgi:hypothetical protein